MKAERRARAKMALGGVAGVFEARKRPHRALHTSTRRAVTDLLHKHPFPPCAPTAASSLPIRRCLDSELDVCAFLSPHTQDAMPSVCRAANPMRERSTLKWHFAYRTASHFAEPLYQRLDLICSSDSILVFLAHYGSGTSRHRRTFK